MSTSPSVVRRRFAVNDVVQLVRATCWAVRFELLIRRAPIQRLCETAGIRLGSSGAAVTKSETTGISPTDLVTIRAVRAVFRRWPLGSGACLREALVLGRLLRYRDPVLCIGVRRHGGAVEAHAWLEFDGLVLDPLAGSYLRLGSGIGVVGEVEGRGL